MSTQPTSIILGPRFGTATDEPTASDLQHVVGRLMVILRQRRWLFAVPLLAGMAVSLAVSLSLPRLYVLSTIFERRDDVVVTKLISTNSPYSFGTLRRSLWINLMGYHVLGTAADELGLTDDLPRGADGELTPEGRARKQQIITRLAGCLELNTLEKSDFLDLIEVRYKGDDPDLGVRLVTRLSENYMRNTQAWIAEILVKSKEFFAAEAAKRRELAVQKEAELLQMGVSHPGVSPSDPDLINQRLMAVNLALEETAMRRQEAQSKIGSLQEYLADLGRSGRVPRTAAGLPMNPQRLRLEQEMDRVKTEIADARALRQMTDNHPHVVGLREKLEQLRLLCEELPEALPVASAEADAETGPPDATAPERRRVQAELKSLQDSLARLDADLVRRQAEKAKLEEDKSLLFERRQNYLMQQEEVQNLKANLRVWEGHVDTISRVLAAEEGKRGICFATVEAARRPQKPVSPTLKGVFLLSMGIGLALGAAAVFLREVFDRTLRDPAKVRQSLGLPVLEMIGEIRDETARPGWFNRRLWLPAVVGLEALAVVAIASLVFLSIERPEVYDRLAGYVALTGRPIGLFGA